MLELPEALRLVLDHARPLPARRMTLREALGLTLAEDVASDIDSPPHDKSMVDGFALMARDLEAGPAELEIVEEIMAGDVPRYIVQAGSCARIMTGAPIPKVADAVVMVERTNLGTSEGSVLGQRVSIEESPVQPGQNILRRATSLRAGEVVLRSGAELRPAEIGLLAEIGRAQVAVVPRPTVAVLSTGNELVSPDAVPAAGQIRNSNGPLLIASIERAGGAPLDLGIARDNRDDLTIKILQGLAADVLVLSGGVSAGVLDLVPGVLRDLGVSEVFHKVRLKPGKPIWFGTKADDSRSQLIFGLPGNPVSSLVCFELFVRPAIDRLMGRGAPSAKELPARLAAPFVHRGDRPTFHPARWIAPETPGELGHVTPLAWQGSADLRTLSGANAFIHFPAGDRSYARDEIVSVRIY